MRLELEFAQLLGLPDEQVPDPEREQIKQDVKHNGTLIWLLQQIISTSSEMTNNILGSDMSAPEAPMAVARMQAKREVLLIFLYMLTDKIRGDDDGN